MSIFMFGSGMCVGLFVGCLGSATMGPPRTFIPYMVFLLFAVTNFIRGIYS